MELLQKEIKERPDAEGARWLLGKAAGLSRSTIFRRVSMPASSERDDVESRGLIQETALEMRAYGYRPITKTLHRRGVMVNHKGVLRILRVDNLLCLRKKAFVRTTDSQLALRIFPNLARDLVLSNINQLWVADITYIRLQREFVYLAVILDAHSRRCIGWALSRHINVQLPLAALRAALRDRDNRPGLVHHSDRGVQYASSEYVSVLQEHGIRISMSRTGNPYDNAKAERFMKTLKYQEVYMNDYDTLAEVQTSVRQFIDEVYNLKRLHSALGYMPPAEFEEKLFQKTLP